MRVWIAIFCAARSSCQKPSRAVAATAITVANKIQPARRRAEAAIKHLGATGRLDGADNESA